MTGLTRTITVGGVSRPELLERLRAAGVQLNESGEQLFADVRFTTSDSPTKITTVELTVADLGLAEGATTAEIMRHAEGAGLMVCPLELGPHLRLEYVDQPEGFVGQPVRPHAAPVGSITVMSAPISTDDGVPKGFYLRRIEGLLWLRGYHAGDDHVWSPDDHLLFAVPD